jgi:hypothetical protein
VASSQLPALEEWRDRVAREMGVPPYSVVTDVVLRGISVAFPSGSSSSPARLEEIPQRGEGSLLAKDEDVVVAVELDQPPVGNLVQEPLVTSGHKGTQSGIDPA